MKIIYVENVRVPSERAHAYQIVQTCAWFARLGHDVTLINPARATADVFDYFHLPSKLFQHIKFPVFDALAWRWMPKKIGYVLERASFIRALRSWSFGQSADLWYTRDPAMVDALSDVTTVGRHWILELHDAPNASPSRWRRVKDRVEKFVVLTEGLKKKLMELGIAAEKIHVAPDGFDPAEFVAPIGRTSAREELGVPTEAFVAMYTGGFFPWKGVDLVVQAWSKTDLRAHLVLIGGPDKDRVRLEGLLDDQTKKRVHFFRTMPRKKVLSLLSAGDVGLLTTSPQFSIGRLYTSPLKQFEYLAAGLPILASDVPSAHEVLNDTIARFYPPTEDGFVTALGQVMRDDGWRDAARRQAPFVVQPYTWEARTRGIAEFVRGSVSGS